MHIYSMHMRSIYNAAYYKGGNGACVDEQRDAQRQYRHISLKHA